MASLVSFGFKLLTKAENNECQIVHQHWVSDQGCALAKKYENCGSRSPFIMRSCLSNPDLMMKTFWCGGRVLLMETDVTWKRQELVERVQLTQMHVLASFCSQIKPQFKEKICNSYIPPHPPLKLSPKIIRTGMQRLLSQGEYLR